jgi:ureidoacrylate peracid hydrolase
VYSTGSRKDFGMTLQREKSVLMVIDMQNGFLEPKGSINAIGMKYEELRRALPGTTTLINAAREAGVPVIYTRYAYMPGFLDGGVIARHLIPDLRAAEGLVSGTWDVEVVDDLAPQSGDIVIDKSRPSSFYGTQLEPVLTSLGVENVVICGVTTNMCVETTARDAGQRDYLVHVISDATAEFEKARHDHALFAIGYAFGWVNTVDEVLAGWGIAGE